METTLPAAPLAVRLGDVFGGLAGLGGLGLLSLLPVGNAPPPLDLEGALSLATIPVAGGLALSGVTLVVLVERTGVAESGREVLSVVGEALFAAGRLALAAVPVLLVFATTANSALYRMLVDASVVVAALFAVVAVAVRVQRRLGAAREAQVWAILAFAVICTLLGRVG